ncbi:MAG: glycine cleavage system aminomethyltransferase GcvT [Spirochaetota bacterium]|nr:MAG: glycine cleavage system aminomethyltransferase GcvT [Spirochaetota bacterium]
MKYKSYSQYVFGKSVGEIDPEVSELVEYEQNRQSGKIVLIPSESICPAPVLEVLGSAFNNIYAEGYIPSMMVDDDEELIGDIDYQLTRYRRYSDRRFYKGCDFVNLIEALAQRRAAMLFATKKNPPENLYVSVQPLSGAAANNAVYDAFIKHGDVVMGMSLMHGGHLTHGSEFNRSGKNYKIVSYEVNPKTERLDYNEILNLAEEHKPSMIIAGYTSYPWAPDWKKFRSIADSVGALLLADISHPAGLVTAGVFPNPVDYADVITCTTHKTLFGPRGAIIITSNPDYAETLEQAVFPGEQGGPHVNKFAAMAVAFKIAQSDVYKRTQKQIIQNAKYLARALENEGLSLAYGGTDTHLMLIDLNKIKTKSGYPLKGEIAVRILDLCGIVANKNTIPGDTVTAEASGIRIGTPWITQRGITDKGIEELGSIIAYILKNINPFTYMGLTGDLPRGKIGLDVLMHARERVKRLAESLVSEKTSVRPHQSVREVPRIVKDKFVFSIKGERVIQFLDQISTNGIRLLNDNEGCYTYLLKKSGSLLAHVYIYRLCGEGFLMVAQEDDIQDVGEWLRGLSDGYIAFDEEDIFRKIEGPVKIEIVDIDEIEAKPNLQIDLQKITLNSSKKDTPSATLYKAYPGLFNMSKPYFIGQGTITDMASDRKTNDQKTDSGRNAVFTYNETQSSPKKSCLYSEHMKLTKSFVEFAGWEMPVRYEGIVEEHRTVRSAAGVFDISHMGVLEVSGEYATHFLDTVTTNYVPWIKNGESQYSYLLDPDGNIIDDIMIYRLTEERYIIIVNAVNADKDLAWMQAVNSGEVIIDNSNPDKRTLGKAEIRDLKDPSSKNDQRVNVALQGPGSLQILKAIADSGRTRSELERLRKTNFILSTLKDIDLIVSRTGYTGEEIGFELLVHPKQAPALWKLLLEKGAKPIGLGARDSLRIEAGLPLYGHELGGEHGISPHEAGFGPYVKFHKPFFIGRGPLLEKMHSTTMLVIRFRLSRAGVRIAKPGDIIVARRGQKVIGSVTSCAVGIDGIQVGMAYVDKRYSNEETPIGIISQPREKQKVSGRIEIGDKVQLHDEAVVLSRFPEDGVT